ncbi:N-acetylmuramoyl-L-alanine amidase [Lysobacter spongiae]|uniref:N-acetylmuramoyl-L-alanine amidase AmiC n=2 Tax=Marilutibacter spongiae TaxID=2025720 RepID=A0A7W3TLP7_9GAMM|nr:N-acetylmuramoyl-L-alanine amidase [Lysobacter spongiae]MBB1060640.1 N-acetylmuramoyl-L-alanine amidase [Lysobacter spongiae]
MGLALLGALAWNFAHAAQIKDLQLRTGATGTRAEIVMDAQGEVSTLSLSGPDRLVVDFPGSDLARGLALPAPSGVVKSVRTGHPVPGTTRIVFDLAQPVAVLKPRVEPGAQGPVLVLEWPGDGVDAAPATAVAAVPAASTNTPGNVPTPATAASVPPSTAAESDRAASSAATTRLISELAARAEAARAAKAAATPTTATGGNAVTTMAASVPARGIPTTVATGRPTPVAPAPAPAQPTPAQVSRMLSERALRPLVIAIDPGHGGQDPGAIGKNGKREKDVTLAVSRELARQINATPGLKAFLTRDSDVFIPLNRRAVLARQVKADIFVSIHADAAENREARGASVYVLSLRGATSQRARWLADKENAADLIGGVRLESTNNTLASVLIDLTQSGQMKASGEAADHVLESLGRVGQKRRVEQANFAVLRTSDMPAMLVETGFISNPDEERLLTDPGYQRKLASAVLEGVNTYFERQPPPGTMYAARASAEMAAASGPGGSP